MNGIAWPVQRLNGFLLRIQASRAQEVQASRVSGCRVGQKLSRLCGSNGFTAVGIGLFMQGSIIPIPAVQR